MQSNGRMELEPHPSQDNMPLEINIIDNNSKVIKRHHSLHRHQTIVRSLQNKEQNLPKLKPQDIDIQEDIQTYLDMQMLNPDWQFAAKHGAASRPGLRSQGHERQECICCFNQINKDPVPLCQNSKQLQFLGFGFPLYFIFLKFAIIILLLLIVNYTAIELYWSITRNTDFCINDVARTIHGATVHCSSFMILLSTIDLHLTTEQHILRISSFVTLLIALIYMRDHFTKTWRYYDERETTYANFAIFMENLPSRAEIQEEGEGNTIGLKLRQFYGNQQLFPNRPRIAHINLIGQFHQLHQLQEEKKELMHKMQKITHLNSDLTSHYKANDAAANQRERQKIYEQKVKIRKEKKQLCLKVRQVTDKLVILKINLKKDIEKQNIDCDKAIICFQTQREMEDVKIAFQKITAKEMQPYFYRKASKIEIGTSARPNSIYWQHINESQISRFWRKLISWIVFIVMLAALATGFYFLFNWKSSLVAHADSRDAAIIVYASIFVIILFNKFILSWIIHHLVQFQRSKTGMGYQFSFMVKYSLGLFFLTAVMTIIVEGVVHKNVYTHHYGIIEEQTIMYFFVAFFVPFIWLINPWYIHKSIKRRYNQNEPFYTQEQANCLMEDPQYIMGKRYGQVLESFWFTFLYASVIPIGSICVFIGLSLYYWVDKYNLLRKSSIKEGVSGGLCMQALNMLELALIFKPGGDMIFDWLIRDQWNLIPAVSLGVAIVYWFLPMQYLLNCLHYEKFQLTPKTYTQHKKDDFFSYQVYNPLSKEEQLKKYYQNIEVCSNKDHQHRNQESHRGIIQQNRDYYKIVRPHQSAKKKMDLFSESDFDGVEINK